MAVLYSIWKQADFDLFVHGGFYLPVWSREYGLKGTVVAPRMQGSSVNLTGARRGGQQGVVDPAAPDAGSATGAGVGAGIVADAPGKEKVNAEANSPGVDRARLETHSELSESRAVFLCARAVTATGLVLTAAP